MGEKTPPLSNLVEELRALRGIAFPSTRELEQVWRALPTLLSALEGEKEGWQDIATAPKQKVILLWALTDTETGNYKMATGYWMPGFGDEPGAWEWEGRRLKAYDVQPTHWQPLPVPPSKGGIP